MDGNRRRCYPGLLEKQVGTHLQRAPAAWSYEVQKARPRSFRPSVAGPLKRNHRFPENLQELFIKLRSGHDSGFS